MRQAYLSSPYQNDVVDRQNDGCFVYKAQIVGFQ
jgi:hypothetical protein